MFWSIRRVIAISISVRVLETPGGFPPPPQSLSSMGRATRSDMLISMLAGALPQVAIPTAHGLVSPLANS